LSFFAPQNTALLQKRFKFKKNGRPIPREAILSFMRNRGIVYDGFQDDKKKKGVKSKQSIKDKDDHSMHDRQGRG
jgi:hypothetical protein